MILLPMQHRTALYALLISYCGTYASQSAFSVNDDVFAYPQYEVAFSPSYISEDEAELRLSYSRQRSQADKSPESTHEDTESDGEYHEMILHGRPYLCSIPHVELDTNTSVETPSVEDQQKELIRATDRGWQLLQDMEGKPCLFYTTGWWSYSFCYNSEVKQFHAHSPNGARVWPPQEDPTTPSYILGRFDAKTSKQLPSEVGDKNEVAEVQMTPESTYLVQKLDGGTPCDLTGKNRKIEVQFHCHSQTTERIGWIKETATCAYLMVIYTPRLCNDVAFQPAKESQAHAITCQEILTIDEEASYQEPVVAAPTLDESMQQPIMVGNIEVGARKWVGKDSKKLERGRVVMTADEKAEIVIMQKDGQVQGLSRTELKKLNLDPEDVESFKKELQEIAGSKDWKIERLGGDGHGQVHLRGIVSSDDDKTKAKKDDDKDSDEENEKQDDDD